jgi:ferredoxin
MFNSYQTNTLEYDPALCIGCKLCAEVCPHAVFRMEGKLAVLVDARPCMECGACMVNCPVDAIRVDSGVGCATAMITAALRGKSIEDKEACACG